jgi:formylmethanofuran dehydrogenase subunit E
MYGHAELLLTRCESCGEQRPTIVVNEQGQKLCARCGLSEIKEKS